LGESRGILPSTEWKRTSYKKAEQQRWYSGETISLGIGQGYNSFTMLQLAHATATIANNGLKMRPHIVREVLDVETKAPTPVAKEPIGQLQLSPENLDIIKRAMIGVNIEGTSATSFAGAQYVSAGKTGTAQVFTVKQNEKYNAATVDERMRDHALYIAFAPADEPGLVCWRECNVQGVVAHSFVHRSCVVLFVLLDGKDLRSSRFTSAHVLRTGKASGRCTFDVHTNHGAFDDVQVFWRQL